MTEVKKIYQTIELQKVGTMTLNPEERGWKCCGTLSRSVCRGDKKRGSSYSTTVYKLIHRNENGVIKHEEDNIGANGANYSDEHNWDGAKDSVEPESMRKYINGNIQYITRNETCTGNKFKYDVFKFKNLSNFDVIIKNIKSKLSDWGIKTENTLDLYKTPKIKMPVKTNRKDCSKRDRFGQCTTVYEEIEVNSSVTMDTINEALKLAKPYLESKESKQVQTAPYTKRGKDNTYYYKLGNALSKEDKDIILSSTTYATNSKDETKYYSATFGALSSDVYIYDERFFYILHKYFTTNKKLLCDILESEILNYFLKHPELLTIYRIQKGYLKYALSKLHTLNPSQNLTVVQFDSQDEETKNKIHSIDGNTSCFMNIETPIIGAMVHSDTLNLLDYNDYVSESMTKFNVKEFLTNDGKIIALDMDKLPYINKNNLDSIYQNSIRSFGNISSNDLTLPGIFISDSGVPSDFINGENSSIKFVSVDAENGQKTLDKISEVKAGTLITFSFDSIGAFKKSSWTDNPELNEAISKAGSEQIMNIQLPYVMLLKQMNPESGKTEYLFEYSTFSNSQNENNIKVLYFRESENKSESKTFLSRESLKTNNCFKFVKNYCGVYSQTNPFGRLITNYNVGDY